MPTAAPPSTASSRESSEFWPRFVDGLDCLLRVIFYLIMSLFLLSWWFMLICFILNISFNVVCKHLEGMQLQIIYNNRPERGGQMNFD